ncbi:MAG: class I SAM-dependent methyltransferase [Candidatus Pacebacteria bacterium]|nr:class I SAM-dependent methyltransferase [Candidatus Paceibacterota bacterium]
MEKNEYKKMFDSESSYWWYVGRRFIIREFLKKYFQKNDKPVLDVGCGTGVNLKLLEEFGSGVLGIDSSEDALNYCRSRGLNNVRMIEQGKELAEPNSFHLVAMTDVLEHIENEEAILRNVYSVLDSGGYLLVTVPAYQFMWSEHDVALHHFRRYTVGRLKKVLSDNGFKVLRASYIISFSFPLVLGYRIIKGLINKIFTREPKTSHVYLPPLLNNFFIWLLKIEGVVVRSINFPFGSSVIAIARKI